MFDLTRAGKAGDNCGLTVTNVRPHVTKDGTWVATLTLEEDLEPGEPTPGLPEPFAVVKAMANHVRKGDTPYLQMKRNPDVYITLRIGDNDESMLTFEGARVAKVTLTADEGKLNIRWIVVVPNVLDVIKPLLLLTSMVVEAEVDPDQKQLPLEPGEDVMVPVISTEQGIGMVDA